MESVCSLSCLAPEPQGGVTWVLLAHGDNVTLVDDLIYVVSVKLSKEHSLHARGRAKSLIGNHNQSKQPPLSWTLRFTGGREAAWRGHHFTQMVRQELPEDVILSEEWREVRETAMKICGKFQLVSRGRRMQSKKESIRGWRGRARGAVSGAE